VTRLLILFIMLFTVTRVAAVTDRPFFQVNPLKPVSIPAPIFRFTVFGDFRPAKADDPYPPQFRQTLDAMKAESPAFAVSVGDAWFGYGGTMEHYRGEVAQFLSLVKGWRVPLYNIIGNHEVTADIERERYLKERFGNLYGSFDYGNVHFICLDTDEVGKEGRITGEQLRWLEQDLERNHHVSVIFVALHRPLFSPLDPDLVKKRSFTDPVNRDALHRLFVRFKVAAVFAGHDHLYEKRVVNGVHYYITGGGGAPLYELPDKGGFYHYLSVAVRGKKTTVEVRRLPERH
jgi:3',5'-cyclic AMP phosphodiesterase CpdA